ncbi:MAG: VWA domain-containing protein [Gammaproteobacteria bacterium]|nr:VWA domain-containing protein [Gammaproteobacteria bacterium]
MFSFLWPYVFVLAPIPWLIWRFMPAMEEEQTQALKVPQIALFKYAHNFQSENKQNSYKKLKITGISLLWLLLLSTIAQPQWVGDPIKLPVSGRDLLLAVDLSGSMQEEDMQIDGKMYNRLIAVKLVVSEFIQKRKGDRLGLILFADHAYLQTPLTYDSQTVETMLIEAELGLAGQKTAIGEAIGLAIKRMKDLPAEQSSSRVLILLTDGANTAGIDPIKVAKLAKDIDLKIYTIGIGADELIVRTVFGRQRVNPSRDLDEDTLKSIAEITGGEYFRARDTNNLKQIYTRINKIEPVESDNKTYRPTQSLFHWPLSAFLLLSFVIAIFYRLDNQVNRAGV